MGVGGGEVRGWREMMMGSEWEGGGLYNEEGSTCMCARMYFRCGFPPCSIEENFLTWKESMWPAVCQYFGVNSAQTNANIREYKLAIHTDLPSDRVFVGESNRLGSFSKQKS